MQTVTEIVEMHLRDGISDEAFIVIVDRLEKQFHMKQVGYLDSELFKQGEAHWSMIMHWQTRDDLKAASRQMMLAPETVDFRDCLDPRQIKIKAFEQVKVWAANG